MDDIVILLRKYQPYSKLHGQAADEIERLRAENRRLHLSLMVAYSEAAGMYDDRDEANRG